MENKELVSKLVKVMASIKRVAKNGQNTFHNYDYVTEADVMEAVREALVKENIFILSSVENSQKDGDIVSVAMKHTLLCGDTGQSLDVKSLGIGQDKGDKAANKAVTAAVKYMLLKNFMISTGDDSEATDENGKSVAVVKGAPAKKYGFASKPKAPPLVSIAKTESATDEF